MKLSTRSYPHPVVGNRDDVPRAAFQATFDFVSDKQFYFIAIAVACSSKSLSSLIQKGAACYVLHVECGNTLYRKAFDFSEPSVRIEVPADRLNGPVEVNCFIRSKRDIEKYRVDGAHVDYGDTAFEVRPGDILAIAEGQVFEAEPRDMLRRIGSIMVIEQSSKPDDHAMEVDFSGEKIRIRLCRQDFDRYKQLKVVPALASHLTTTIVLPVLIEALHLVDDKTTEFEDFRWHRSLRGRVEDLKLTGEQDALCKAQGILEMPIRRALASATSYVADRES